MVKKSLKEEELAEKLLQPNFSFPKNLKIRKSFEYRAFSISRNRLKGQYMTLDYRFNTKIFNPRLGLSVSRKNGNANRRNRFKRIAREVFRLNKQHLIQNLELHIIARKCDKHLNYKDMEKDFFDLIVHIKK